MGAFSRSLIKDCTAISWNGVLVRVGDHGVFHSSFRGEKTSYAEGTVTRITSGEYGDQLFVRTLENGMVLLRQL